MVDVRTNTNATTRGWGDPDSNDYHKNMVKVECPGPFPLWMHRKVAKLFEQLLKELKRLNYQPRSYGAYNNRDVRGRPGVKSNHAWGIAADLNADKNPMTDDNRTHTDMPRQIGDIAEGLGILWGGRYTGTRRDPMHFEFKGTPADADRLTVALNKPKAPAVSAVRRTVIKKPVGRRPVRLLRLHDNGEDVKWIQWRLGMPTKQIDGIFGPVTYQWVRNFQRRKRLQIDGIVGPQTRRALE